MKKSVIVPLVMLATLTTLTACTQDAPRPAPSHETGEHRATPPLPRGPHAPAVSSETPPLTATASTSMTHTRVVEYRSPAGMDEVEFSVTVQSGVITAASSKTLATNDGSKYNQDKFASEVSAKVVGKSPKGLDLDTIGGASLTTAAFEQFVQSL